MAKIAVEAENTFSYRANFRDVLDHHPIKLFLTNQEAMAISGVQLSFELNSKAIICFTESGLMALLLSKYRPEAFIIAVSIEDKVIKGLAINHGIVCLKVPSFQGADNIIKYAVKTAAQRGFVNPKDRVVLILGQNEEHPDQDNIMKVIQVPDVIPDKK